MEDLIKEVIKFRNERNWRQFHNAKDVALSLSLEASELLELFQWKTAEETVQSKYDEIGEELADILYYVLLLSSDLNIDPRAALMNKLKKNEEKYPIDKSYGSNKKYTEL